MRGTPAHPQRSRRHRHAPQAIRVDGGRSFGEQTVVWADAGHTCGNPCPIVDRTTGDYLVADDLESRDDEGPGILDGTSTDTRRVFVTSSRDDGLTWSEPAEITETTKQPNWTWYATGPGAGIQIEGGTYAGRLVVPCDHIEKGGRDTKLKRSHVLTSDDAVRRGNWAASHRSRK